jgi:hypothetical protein
MTRKRNDQHSTEFGLWIREQKELDSHIGYRNYNLDIIWWFKKSWSSTEPENWMLIEEKRNMAKIEGDQRQTFFWLHKKILKLNDNTYRGFYVLQFENTNPDDGRIFIHKREINCTTTIKEVTKEELISFFKFELNI